MRALKATMLFNNRKSEDIDNTSKNKTKNQDSTRRQRRGQKTEWVDDGRVVADMSVDGMPGTLSDKMFTKNRPMSPRIDAYGQQIPAPEPVELTKDEKREIRRGVMKAYLLLGGGFALLYTLLMLFLVFVWMA